MHSILTLPCAPPACTSLRAQLHRAAHLFPCPHLPATHLPHTLYPAPITPHLPPPPSHMPAPHTAYLHAAMPAYPPDPMQHAVSHGSSCIPFSPYLQFSCARAHAHAHTLDVPHFAYRAAPYYWFYTHYCLCHPTPPLRTHPHTTTTGHAWFDINSPFATCLRACALVCAHLPPPLPHTTAMP